jgi:hypothetical protein
MIHTSSENLSPDFPPSPLGLKRIGNSHKKKSSRDRLHGVPFFLPSFNNCRLMAGTGANTP